jgi:hypothetical protein
MTFFYKIKSSQISAVPKNSCKFVSLKLHGIPYSPTDELYSSQFRSRSVAFFK